MKTIAEWKLEGYAFSPRSIYKHPAKVEIIDGKEVRYYTRENMRELIPTRIFSFDIQNKKRTERSPWASVITNEDFIWEQLRLAQQYEDCAIELEIFFRKKYRIIRKECFPEIESVDRSIVLKNEILESLRESVRARNIDLSKKTATPEEKLLERNLKLEIKKLKEEIKKFTSPVFKEKINQLKEEKDNKFKLLHKKFVDAGLFWGSANAKEKDIKKCLSKKGSDPELVRYWNGNGKVSVQFQSEMTWQRAMSCRDNRLQVKLANGSRLRKKKIKTEIGVSVVERHIDYVVRLHIGNHNGENVYTEFNLNYDRDIPDGLIRWIYINREKIDGIFKYKCSFVVSSKEGFPKLGATSGTVGIDLGWREINKIENRYDGLYATCNFSDGSYHECLLPWDIINKRNYISSLQGIRDRELIYLKEKLKNFKSDSVELQDKMKKIVILKSPRKIKEVCLSCLELSKEIPCIKDWLKKESHIAGIQNNLSIKLSRRKDVLMKNEIANIRKKAKHIFIGDDELTKLSRRSALMKNDNKNATQKKNRNFSQFSPGKFRQLVTENGGEEIDCRNTTTECPHCKKNRVVKSDKILVCEHCEAVSDRDKDAAYTTRCRGEFIVSERLGCRIEDLR